MKLEYPPGATPLDPDEIVGLIPIHIMTQNQLNEWEQANILEAENWVFSRRGEPPLSFDFCIKLHQKMFDKTWKWAGKFRRSNKNIGVFWEQISVQLKTLIDDVHFQIENEVYSIDEIALRFHHRLVLIHPFPNGNGRHARLITDAFLHHANQKTFSWGRENLINNTATRKSYIRALRKADQGKYEELRKFVRS